MNSAYSIENTISIVNIHTLLLGFKKDDTDYGFSEQLIQILYLAAVSFMDLTNLIFFSKGLTLGFQFSNDFGRISHSSGAKKKKKKKRKPKRATLRRSRFIVNLFLRSHVFS